ncbi:hypothetical protein XA68_12444 [Ophiocordyceps unilateralis]|uniref:Cwf19-like C-terminal domain-containing protein n=1 Tax=Ophiocordyceps unilateralis TaxID=268505 RepID=A0A2A9PCZ4_OPHUN|nr:hypothetical protein XA68_12444 [Ophiocordyceps unilateralis]
MDGLDEFEKTLAAEQAERERRRDGKHRHHRRHHHHHHDGRRHDGVRKEDSHRKHDGERDRDEEDGHRHRHRHRDDDKDAESHRRRRKHRDEIGDDNDNDNDEQQRHKRNKAEKSSDPPLVRDAWMTAPTSLAIKHQNHSKRPRSRSPPKRTIHSRELNTSLLSQDMPAPQAEDYTFGDEGSSWRMIKLQAVVAAAADSGRPVEQLALDKYGSLAEFDDAREEQLELQRREIYGEGYRRIERPTGQLHSERRRNEVVVVEPEAEEDDREKKEPKKDDARKQQPLDHTSLNRLRAQMMKAKLRRAPEAAQLEAEYNLAASSTSTITTSSSSSSPAVVVLNATHSRHLINRGNEVQASISRRGESLTDNDDMTIADMVRQERRTRLDGDASSARRQAERIARDGGFDAGLDYLDDNAVRLARGLHRSQAALRSVAASEAQRMTRALDRCQLCRDDSSSTQHRTRAPIISLATRVFLTLTPEPEVTPGGAVIAPITHHATLLECDDDEWHELRNFMKSLTRMYHDQGRDIIFYENTTSSPNQHASIIAAPIPYDRGGLAPAFFREAILEAAPEWRSAKKSAQIPSGLFSRVAGWHRRWVGACD